MSDLTPKPSVAGDSVTTREKVERSLRSRYRNERLFQAFGIAAIVVSLAFVAVFFISIISQGYSAFTQTFIELDIYFDQEIIDPAGSRSEQTLSAANYSKLVKDSLKILSRRCPVAVINVHSTGW